MPRRSATGTYSAVFNRSRTCHLQLPGCSTDEEGGLAAPVPPPGWAWVADQASGSCFAFAGDGVSSGGVNSPLSMPLRRRRMSFSYRLLADNQSG